MARNSRLSSRNHSRSRSTTAEQKQFSQRVKILVLLLLAGFLITTSRLFYWQVIMGPTLSLAALNQYERAVTSSGSRGIIYSADGHPLVTNQTVYRLFVEPPLFAEDSETVAYSLAKTLTESLPEDERLVMHEELQDHFQTKLNITNQKWVSLQSNLSEQEKQIIQDLEYSGIGFEPYQRRYYPEASMAAHLVGFVGKDEEGNDTGYFGLEGALENELKARNTTKVIQTDALGKEFLEHFDPDLFAKDGRSIVTTIRRDIQYLITQELQQGIRRMGAEKGEILIIEPKTGKVLAYSAFPDYNPAQFNTFDPELYKNPGLTEAYEPGSTFKVLTVAAGIDAGLISPETQCPVCSGPRTFGKFTIKTWNETYNPNITMIDALRKSDNTAMIYIAELLGTKRMSEYIQAFGISNEIGLELQEDTATPYPDTWVPVELATRSFGQGILTNSFQLVRAVGAIANEGKVMDLYIVDHVVDPFTDTILKTEPQVFSEPISAETAQLVTKMMEHSASGAEKRSAFDTYPVAGKSGTSQVAGEGSYVDDRTIASFIGFGPTTDPAFVMLVKLHAPSSSSWGAETAAPIWYDIAEKLKIML